MRTWLFRLPLAVIVLSILGTPALEGDTIVRSDGYHAVTLLDLDNPIAPGAGGR